MKRVLAIALCLLLAGLSCVGGPAEVCDAVIEPGGFEVVRVTGTSGALLGAEVDSDGEHLWIRWTDDDGDHEVQYAIQQ